MKIKFTFGILLPAFLMTASLFGQVSVTIYDPVRTAPEKSFTDAEAKLVTTKAVPKARARWKNVSGCDGGDLDIIGGASS